ncbi:MAG: DUF2062 domain-containing protein, partial [Candidatus Omnitrophica bacterium]|nr:DUF2062 domain-containing protein [Candidatus Omnitrophota bacterium]
MSEEISRGLPSLDGVWCVIPVYNNARTVRDVVCGCLQKVPNVLVVDDGSTDADIPALLRDTGSIVLRHERNRGKGEALKTALRHIRRNGARFMITLDADAQHYPQDLPRFLERLCEERVLIGNRDFDSASVPERSKFGRAFSNLWFRMETGLPALDTQSGYRAYPVEYLSRLVVASRGYDYEMEVLVRAAWAGLSIDYVPVGVHYPPAHERVSSFHPFRDNLRLSLLHTRLVGRRLLPWPHRRLIERKRKGYFDPGLFRHPSRFLRQLLKEHATPSGLAAAAFVGVFLGVLPLLSVHTLVILYVAGRLHLNKVMAVTIQHICMPPFVPVLCIEIGHYLLYGRWLTRVSFQSVFGELGDRVWEWLIGSLIVAPVLAALCAGVVFHAALRVRKKKTSGRKRGNALGFWFFRAAV